MVSYICNYISQKKELEKQVISLRESLSKSQLSLSEKTKLYNDCKKELENEREDFKRKITVQKAELCYEKDVVQKKYDDLKRNLELRNEELDLLFKCELKYFPHIAGVISDYLTYDLEILAKGLDWGSDVKRIKKVASIRELRAEAKLQIQEARIAYYQLEYLKQIFPGIEDVLEIPCDELREIQRIHVSDEEILSYNDGTKDYLSKEEWDTLSPRERNQLALDRYIASKKKSKWQIGRDYELFVGYTYEKKGYYVDYFGSYQKLEDLGRDLIVQKGIDTAIVQCKYWSKEKLIHEKHITQLYGTTVSYCCENNIPLGSVKSILITNISLSDTAKKMAEYLGVKYKEHFEMGEYPRIKCNIGKDEYGNPTMIYHLPMDQQYDSVKIEKNGEFFAFTVEEAERAGFRRAYKWFGQ